MNSIRKVLLFVVLFLLSFLSPLVISADNLEQKVRGLWLVTTPADIRTWVLDVRKHKESRVGNVEYYGYYGPNGAQFPKPLDIVFSTGSASLTLTTLIDGARIDAREESQDVFRGTYTNASGKTIPIRLDRNSEDDIRKRAFNIPAMRNSTKLDIIYLSTDDCIYCKRWEARSKDALLNSPEGKGATFYAVKGETLQKPIEAQHYPSQLKWVYEQIGPSRGVPRFLLAMDSKIVLDVYERGYSTTFLPALRELVSRRDSAK